MVAFCNRMNVYVWSEVSSAGCERLSMYIKLFNVVYTTVSVYRSTRVKIGLLLPSNRW